MNRLVETIEADGRYHIHAAIHGLPSLISVQGMIEGPARPREYCALRGRLSEEEIFHGLGGKFLREGDPGLTEVMKGYVMQALFYHLTGPPFCEEKSTGFTTREGRRNSWRHT